MKSFLLGKVLISSTKRTKERKKWIFMGKKSWKRKHLAKKNSSWIGPEGGEHIEANMAQPPSFFNVNFSASSFG